MNSAQRQTCARDHPRYSRNVHIPGDGARMSDVVQRYHDVSKLPNAPRPIQSEYDSATNIQAANSGGGGGK